MPKGRTTKHRRVILQPNKGWLSDQPPVEETENEDRNDGQERKGQQAKEAGQQERIRLEGEFLSRPAQAALLHRAYRTLARDGDILFEFIHMLDPLNESGHAL